MHLVCFLCDDCTIPKWLALSHIGMAFWPKRIQYWEVFFFFFFFFFFFVSFFCMWKSRIPKWFFNAYFIHFRLYCWTIWSSLCTFAGMIAVQAMSSANVTLHKSNLYEKYLPQIWLFCNKSSSELPIASRPGVHFDVLGTSMTDGN